MQETAPFSLPRPEDSSDEAEDADKTSDESEESVPSNAVQLQGPSPSPDRPHGSRSDMEESSDNSRRPRRQERRPTHHSGTPKHRLRQPAPTELSSARTAGRMTILVTCACLASAPKYVLLLPA